LFRIIAVSECQPTTTSPTAARGKKRRRENEAREKTWMISSAKWKWSVSFFVLCASKASASWWKVFFPAADAYSVSSVITIVLETQPYQITPE